MRVTYLKITVKNTFNPMLKLTRRFLVNSGAVYSVIPEEELVRFKIKPIDTQKFLLANGEEVEKKIEETSFVWRNKERVVPVIFGERGVYLIDDERILG